MHPLVTLGSAIAGVLLGATLQYLYGQRAERRRQLQTVRATAYAEYLLAIAEAAHAENQEAHVAALLRFAATKAKIVVCGSQAVVEALNGFEAIGAAVTSTKGQPELVAVCNAMRRDLGQRSLPDATVKALIIGDLPRPDLPPQG